MGNKSAVEWGEALDLKKKGNSYVGACPLCGGTDRFHVTVRPNGCLVGCRGCIDGERPAVRKERFLRIVEKAFGSGEIRRMTPEERRQIVRRQAAHEKRQKEREKSAAKRAQLDITRATIDMHPYLADKGFPNYKMLVLDLALVVPIRNARREILTLQLIAEDGLKRFLPGGRVKGGAYQLGRGKERWTVEGLATGLSVYAALRRLERDVTVYCAFSTSNLPHIATKGAVVADNDESGAGVAAAEKTGRPFWTPPEVGDANDFHLNHGLDQLAAELREWIKNARRKT